MRKGREEGRRGKEKETRWSRSEGAELNGEGGRRRKEEVNKEKRRGKGGGWVEDNKLVSKSTSLGMDMMSG